MVDHGATLAEEMKSARTLANTAILANHTAIQIKTDLNVGHIESPLYPLAARLRP